MGPFSMRVILTPTYRADICQYLSMCEGPVPLLLLTFPPYMQIKKKESDVQLVPTSPRLSERGFVFIPVLTLGQSADSCSLCMMAGRLKERRRDPRSRWGCLGGGFRYGKDVVTSQLLYNFLLLFLPLCRSFLTLLPHSILPKLSCLTRALVVEYKRTSCILQLFARTHDLHVQTWPLSVHNLWSVAFPFYPQEMMFNEFFSGVNMLLLQLLVTAGKDCK